MTDEISESQASIRPVPKNRDAFPAFRQIATRWMDVDVYGHVNNVHYLSFFDTAVNAWNIEKGLLDSATSSEIFLVVETGCHYFAELVFPETIDVGLSISKIGSSSVVYEIGLFKPGMESAAAQGRFVHVLTDRTTRRPVQLSAEMCAALELLIT
ncbi:acyl-CoA thioesterase [Roseibium algae]|uniref:Thioesterase family protein n=1 Tax=Roseibium algae TaxID=3123038 RepID=A0ABU8TKB2_9HYPH